MPPDNANAQHIQGPGERTDRSIWSGGEPWRWLYFTFFLLLISLGSALVEASSKRMPRKIPHRTPPAKRLTLILVEERAPTPAAPAQARPNAGTRQRWYNAA